MFVPTAALEDLMPSASTPFGTVSLTCRTCGEDHVVKVRMEDYARWQGGTLIQNAMPYLSIDERELLISGTCGACFDRMFADLEEE